MKKIHTYKKRKQLFACAVTAMVLAAGMVMGCKQPSVTVNAYPVAFSAVGGTVTAAVDGKVIANGALIAPGKTVTFTAHPQSGMRVSRWTGIENAGDKPTASLTVKAAVTVTAECTAIMHTVTFTQSEHGSLTASLDGKAFKGGAVAEGKTVLFTAEPDAGYTVKQWTGAGKAGSTDKTVAVMVEKESTVAVEFIDAESLMEKYRGSFSAAPENGTLRALVDGEPFTGGTVQKGKTIVFTAVPADGYRVKEWTGTDNPASTDKTAVLTVKDNATVSVEFESIGQLFSVTFDSPQNGTLTASLDGTAFTGGNAQEGKIIVFTAEPAPTYRVRKWTGWEDAGTQTVRTLTVTKDVHVSVEFINVPEYSITFSQPEHGSLTATLDGAPFDGTQTVAEGKHIVFTAIAEPGYRLLKWENVNTDPNHGYVKVHTVKADKTVSVTFEPDDILTIRKFQYSEEYYVESCKKTAKGVIEVPEYVKYIGYEAFKDCVKVTEVKFLGEAKLTEIGSYAFSGCTGLTSINLPAGVTQIGSKAFSGCMELTSITIPDGVTEIGSYTFYGCTGLKDITIGAMNITKIGSSAFYDIHAEAKFKVKSGSNVKQKLIEYGIDASKIEEI